MNFNLNDEQRQLDDLLRRFVSKDYGFEQRNAILRSEAGFSRDTWQALADLGVLALNVPEDHGGLNAGSVETMIVMQALGRGLVLEPVAASAVVATHVLREVASDEQQAELLPAMAAGERIVVLAHEESAAEGDVSRVATTARRDGDGWVLDGHKPVVMHAAAADELLVSARTSGQPGDVQGVSLFRVPAGTAGLLLRSLPTVDGQRAADVKLQGLRLSASALIGTEGAASEGIRFAQDKGLAALMADALGAMESVFDATVEYLKTRQQFGQPIGRFQALQHRAADMVLHLEQSRSMVVLATLRGTQGPAAERARILSAAKVTLGQAARFIGQNAVQLHGGMGMTDELALSHGFKRLVAFELRGGETDEHLARFAQLSRAAA
ncbi:MAG: acyl-CoA dehydrogenase family protein [Burkholderiales bacterium]|nr:acyl-CoA dehydrogenase family protein [Burkholderiales bacterium]